MTDKASTTGGQSGSGVPASGSENNRSLILVLVVLFLALIVFAAAPWLILPTAAALLVWRNWFGARDLIYKTFPQLGNAPVGWLASGAFVAITVVLWIAFGSSFFQRTPVQSTSQPSSASSSPPYSDLAYVAEVVDGDTIKIQIAGRTETIRLIGIDTPETVAPGTPVQCFGPQASDAARSLLLGQNVVLYSDYSQGDRDKYSRLLRYVTYGDKNYDYGMTMIANGYAKEYTYNTPYRYQASYRQAEANAQYRQLGLWSPSTCNGDTTQPFRP